VTAKDNSGDFGRRIVIRPQRVRLIQVPKKPAGIGAVPFAEASNQPSNLVDSESVSV
jgi:hypothetical protein